MLTDAVIRRTRPGLKPIKLSDSGGLFLLIQPNGSKLWRQAYRYAGRQKTLAHGIYPHVSLASARTRRDEAKRLLATDVDPGVHKRLRKENTGDTFGAIAAEVVAKQEAEGKAPGTITR